MSPDWQVSQVASSPIMRRMMKAKPMLTPTPNSMRKSVSMDSMPLPGPRVAALNEVREAIQNRNIVTITSCVAVPSTVCFVQILRALEHSFLIVYYKPF